MAERRRLGRPVVSVIVPAYNAGRHLPAALDSAVSQDYAPIEIIAVDDGSTDDTAAIARRHEAVVLVTQANAGVAAARNAGVARATGDFYAFLDADDVWLPGKLAAQVDALGRHPDADGAICGIEEFHSPELAAAERLAHPIRDGVHVARLASGLMIRAAGFARVGPFRVEAEPGGELIDWFLRADEAGVRLLRLPHLFVRRRVHADNSGIRAVAAQRAQYVRSVKRSLDRRRRAPG